MISSVHVTCHPTPNPDLPLPRVAISTFDFLRDDFHNFSAHQTGSDALYIYKCPRETNTKQEKPFETGKLSYIIGLRATRIEETVCKAKESCVHKASQGLLRLLRKLQCRSLRET